MLKSIRVRSYSLIASLVLATCMDSINMQVTSVDLPEMAGRLHATPDERAWINIAYLASRSIGLMVAPTLSEILGRKRILACAIITVTIASVLCTLQDEIGWLCFWRAVQGLGGAPLFVTGLQVLFLKLPLQRQGITQAFFALANMLGTTVFPFFLGWISDRSSWHWVFLQNVPIGALSLYLLRASLRRDTPTRSLAKFDQKGVVLLGLAAFTLQFALTQGTRYNWGDEPLITACLIVGGLATLAFALWQRSLRNRNRLFDFRVLLVPEYVYGLSISLLAGYATSGSGFLFPNFVRSVFQYNSADTGLALLPSGIAAVIGLFIGGYGVQSKRFSPSIVLWTGISFLLSSMLLLSVITYQVALGDLMIPLVLRGGGLGLLAAPSLIVAFSRLNSRHVAHGAGLFNLARQLGGSLATASLSWRLAYGTEYYRNIMASRMSFGSPVAISRIAETIHNLTSHGIRLGQAAKTAIAVSNLAFKGQIDVLSYNDCFQEVALVYGVGVTSMIALRKYMNYHSDLRRSTLSGRLESRLASRELATGASESGKI
ncbi:MAG: MFS transporter [Oligoflexia bacterium]|nr:MFS transporter [Oligoflexia bacterium]